MSNSSSSSSSGGIGFFGLLGVLFIGLKLTGHIDWSWWYVTAPLWGPPLVALGIGLCVGLVFLAIWGVRKYKRHRQDMKRQHVADSIKALAERYQQTKEITAEEKQLIFDYFDQNPFISVYRSTFQELYDEWKINAGINRLIKRL